MLRGRRTVRPGALARILRDRPTGAAHSGRVAVVGASVGQGHDGAVGELVRRLGALGVEVTVRPPSRP